MIGRCNFILDNDQVCNKTFYLHGIIFLNPETPGTIERVDLCKLHYESLTDDHTQRIRQFQMQLKNMIAQNERQRLIAKKNDIPYNDTIIWQKISDLRSLLSHINTTECKNYLCMADISKIDQYKKIYTVITLKPSNKIQFKFYFCSLKCFNSFRSRCGIVMPIQKGQMVLSTSQ